MAKFRCVGKANIDRDHPELHDREVWCVGFTTYYVQKLGENRWALYTYDRTDTYQSKFDYTTRKRAGEVVMEWSSKREGKPGADPIQDPFWRKMPGHGPVLGAAGRGTTVSRLQFLVEGFEAAEIERMRARSLEYYEKHKIEEVTFLDDLKGL